MMLKEFNKCSVVIAATLFLSCSSKSGLLTQKNEAGMILDQKIQVGNLSRGFDIFQPSNLKGGERYPLVISLHGHFGSKEYNSGTSGKKSPHKVFREVGEREKFFVVYPQGEKGSDNVRGWNGCRADAKTNPDTDDTTFISDLIEYMTKRYPVDPNRVYVTGTSNGGGMAFRLAVEIPEKLAAVAIVVFSAPAISECGEPKKPISILYMNGTKDPLAPYGGGRIGSERAGRGTVLSVKDSIDLWLKVDGISKSPEVVSLPDADKSDSSQVEVQSYRGGKDGTEVVHYKIIGGGHVEPSLKEHLAWLYLKMVAGPQNKDIETAEELWKFFSRHSR